MKIIVRSTVILFGILFYIPALFSQAVSINASGAPPHASASLDVQSTVRGLLIPRMSSAERMAIPAPATGLMVYDLTTNNFWCFAGSQWLEIKAGVVALMSDADGDTKIELEANPDDDTIRLTAGGFQLVKIDGKTMHLNAPGNSVFIGKNAGKMDDGTANENVHIGHRTGESNTSGFSNVGIGSMALTSNVTG